MSASSNDSASLRCFQGALVNLLVFIDALKIIYVRMSLFFGEDLRSEDQYSGIIDKV